MGSHNIHAQLHRPSLIFIFFINQLSFHLNSTIQCPLLYYILEAQLFLQPHPVPHRDQILSQSKKERFLHVQCSNKLVQLLIVFISIQLFTQHVSSDIRSSSGVFSLLYLQPPVICVAACLWHCLVVNFKFVSSCSALTSRRTQFHQPWQLMYVTHVHSLVRAHSS
jgi:hypothetical protein